MTVDPADIRQALSTLKDGGYRLIVFLTYVDHLVDASRSFPARYEFVYELRDMDKPEHLRVRAFVDGEPPCLHPVHHLFPPANWEYRRPHDMFGIVFEDHP